MLPTPAGRAIRSTLTSLAALSLAAVAFPALAQDFDAIDISTTPVRDNIYMLQGSGGNIGVVAGEEGTLIVDDQYAPLTEKIVAAIREFTDKPVNFVVNTHFHFDHTGGNTNFGRAGAWIVAQDNSRKRMEATQVLTGSGRVQEAYEEVGLPKITFYDTMRFYLNGQSIDLVNTGDGHTDGDVQVYFREANVMHTGDMFVRYGLPFIDTDNGGSLDGMIDGVQNLVNLVNENTIVIPGHGQLASRQDMIDYRNMLVVIRSNIVRARVQGMNAQEMLDSEPATGFAPRNENTDDWLMQRWSDYQ
ncbi:MAG: MBL fold metallo-hydrolase [Pseudohongiellaceae bacterium]